MQKKAFCFLLTLLVLLSPTITRAKLWESTRQGNTRDEEPADSLATPQRFQAGNHLETFALGIFNRDNKTTPPAKSSFSTREIGGGILGIFAILLLWLTGRKIRRKNTRQSKKNPEGAIRETLPLPPRSKGRRCLQRKKKRTDRKIPAGSQKLQRKKTPQERKVKTRRKGTFLIVPRKSKQRPPLRGKLKKFTGGGDEELIKLRERLEIQSRDKKKTIRFERGQEPGFQQQDNRPPLQGKLKKFEEMGEEVMVELRKRLEAQSKQKKKLKRMEKKKEAGFEELRRKLARQDQQRKKVIRFEREKDEGLEELRRRLEKQNQKPPAGRDGEPGEPPAATPFQAKRKNGLRLLVMLLALSFPILSQARLWESIAECDRRYGKPVKTKQSVSRQRKYRTYLTNNTQVKTAFLWKDGQWICVSISYTRVDGNEWSEEEIQSFLTGTASEGEWKLSPGTGYRRWDFRATDPLINPRHFYADYDLETFILGIYDLNWKLYLQEASNKLKPQRTESAKEVFSKKEVLLFCFCFLAMSLIWVKAWRHWRRSRHKRKKLDRDPEEEELAFLLRLQRESALRRRKHRKKHKKTRDTATAEPLRRQQTGQGKRRRKRELPPQEIEAQQNSLPPQGKLESFEGMGDEVLIELRERLERQKRQHRKTKRIEKKKDSALEELRHRLETQNHHRRGKLKRSERKTDEGLEELRRRLETQNQHHREKTRRIEKKKDMALEELRQKLERQDQQHHKRSKRIGKKEDEGLKELRQKLETQNQHRRKPKRFESQKDEGLETLRGLLKKKRISRKKHRRKNGATGLRRLLEKLFARNAEESEKTNPL